MSGVSGDCITIVFHTSENMDLAVGIVSISKFLAKLYVLPVYYGFMAAILNFLLISMSGTSGDCTIVFPTFVTIDLAVGIVSISQFVARLQVLPVYSMFLVAVLNFRPKTMSRISITPNVFPASNSIGAAVAIVLISQCAAML